MKITVLVSPKSKKNAVEDVSGQEGTLRVRTTAAAADNKANFAVIDMLAEHFGVSKSQISIIRGHTSRKKVVEVFVSA